MTILLKWAGGKRREAQAILTHPAAAGKRYIIEPFAGSAAVSFSSKLIIKAFGESNQELRSFYQAVKDDPQGFHSWLVAYADLYRSNPDEVYKKVKTLDVAQLSPTLRAARMYFLNKTAFNGLWRQNRKGEFNVSRDAKRDTLSVPTPEEMAKVQFMLSQTALCPTWQEAIDLAGEDDLVYLDPPYYGMAVTYGQPTLTADDFCSIRQKMEVAAERGAACIMSHADSPKIREVFEGFTIQTIKSKQIISCKAETRGDRNDLLIICGDKHAHSS